jgi:hypothetical protein
MTMTKDAKADFRDCVEDVQAGMLGLTIDGKLVRMSPNLRKMRDGKIWFIAAKGEEIVKNTSASPSAGAL